MVKVFIIAFVYLGALFVMFNIWLIYMKINTFYCFLYPANICIFIIVLFILTTKLFMLFFHSQYSLALRGLLLDMWILYVSRSSVKLQIMYLKHLSKALVQRCIKDNDNRRKLYKLYQKLIMVIPHIVMQCS